MIPPDQVQAQLQLCKENFTAVSKKLLQQDKERLQCLQQFIKAKSFEQDVPLYTKFIVLNNLSLDTVKEVITGYETILAYVLLLQDKGHRSDEFQDLFTRYQMVEKKLKTIASLRKKEAKILTKLTKKQGIIGTLFAFNFTRNPLERVFKVYIQKEVRIAQEIIALFASSQETLQKLQTILRREARKEQVQLVVSTTLFVVPLAGTVLFVVSSLTLTWANEFTANYKQLLVLLAEMESEK